MQLYPIAFAGTMIAVLTALPGAAQNAGAAGDPGAGLATPPDQTQEEAANLANAREWDLDGNGTITGAEFMSVWEERNLFARWDENADGNITSEELARGFLSYYDQDGSEMIEEYEQDEFGSAMGTEGFFGG